MKVAHPEGTDDRSKPAPVSASGKLARAVIAIPRLGLAERPEHEIASLRAAAQRLGQLLELPVLPGSVSESESWACYCIPISTWSFAEARAHGIEGADELWGGIVPYEFVGTKLISHPVWPGSTRVPRGWQALPGIESCTLLGFSVFDSHGAEAAVSYLLKEGSVRIKAPYARGGNGQTVLFRRDDVERWLDTMSDDEISAGVVVERNLQKSVTHSIGSATLPGREISYYGQQRTTLDPDGKEVYAGSTLVVFNGPSSSMLRELTSDVMAEFVSTAMRYDDIVSLGYHVIASRRNYDVIEGMDENGSRHIGVLEQSWRFGGASMAEVLALEYFSKQRASRWVTTETVETYTTSAAPPDAVITWPSDAGLATPLKYARIVCDGRRT